MSRSEELKACREYFRRRAWRDAFEAFSAADATSQLKADDLELFATSAYLIGRETDFWKLLERACEAHRHSGENARAARCGFWLGLMLMFSGETGKALGWLAQARRFVEGDDCVEQGYFMLPVAEEWLEKGDADAAHSTATEAAKIGERFEDSDLIACARHLQGRALIRREQVHEGLVMLDEVMLEAIAGRLSPIVTGLIYCSLVEACQQIFALDRAREWTTALAQWCDDQPQMISFTGTCLLYRAQIKQLSGEWQDAKNEILRACERFSLRGDTNPPAKALYEQAELHRLRGELSDADHVYREVARLGSEPQPGLAMLRMAQGRIDAACAGIQRALSTTTDLLQRARFLPACVDILLSAGETEEAISACKELTDIANRFDTPALQALAARARGSVELRTGDSVDALRSLRHAFELWQSVEAPFEAARTRVLLGRACHEVGDHEAADMELEAARAMFAELGARQELLGENYVAAPGGHDSSHPLTPRELEVLRLVADGMTNKAIAAKLHLSERTIDRHVSNTLTKLNVASRAAATAYAYRHNLI